MKASIERFNRFPANLRERGRPRFWYRPRKGFVRRGRRLIEAIRAPKPPPDFQPEDIKLYEQVAPFTMGSPERVLAMGELARYVVGAGLGGAIVECGVWRGGSMMAVANALLSAGERSIDLFLFDTFEGMTAPTARDVTHYSQSAASLLSSYPKQDGHTLWCYASEQEVTANMRTTGYPPERIHLVRGRVEDTIPELAPSSISVVRLDTDFYESTRHELLHLYERVVPGGAIVIDDYGHWRGSREATEEFLASLPTRPFLHRVDYACRIFFKPQTGA